MTDAPTYALPLSDAADLGCDKGEMLAWMYATGFQSCWGIGE